MNEQMAREILGIGPDASFRTAKVAYRNLVRIHHPDRAGRDVSEQKKASEQMARLNQAWELLEDREKRGVYGKSADNSTTAQEPTDWIGFRSRLPHECELCGSSPAKRVNVRGLQQIIFRYALIGYKGNLCRSCAQSAANEALRTTLTQGWWGIFWFANYYFVVTLLLKKFLINRMQVPIFRDARVVTPFDIPLYSGNNPLKQPAPLIFLFIATALLGASMLSDGGTTSNTKANSNTSANTITCWTNQDSNGMVRVVDCNSSSAYFIEIAEVFDQSRCPSWSWGSIRDENSSRFFCVGLKQ